jgi:pimeloyl-ACP methyl ester carboxylesterase
VGLDAERRRVVSVRVSLDDWRAAGGTFGWRGHDIFARVSGAGAPLLLLHGFPTASWDWSPLWAPLVAAGYRVMALDMIGYGLSAKPRDFDYSIHTQADLIQAFLAREGVTRLRVLAHDVGDTVLQELLARQRGGAAVARIEAACLLNGGLFPETHRARVSQKLLASRLGPLLAARTTYARFAASMRGVCARPLSDDDVETMWELVRAGDGLRVMPALIGYIAERRANRARWVGALVGADVPVRLVAGLDDPVSGAHMVARYRELVPRADVVELPGVGHYPQIEAPGQVLPAVLAHFARVA